jgi:alpha 1,2-mannosyltransferase
MRENNKKYGWVMSLYEFCTSEHLIVLTIAETIPTLWQTVRDFAKKYPSYIAKDNSVHFMVDEPDKGLDGSYNMCHVFSPTFHSYKIVLVKL